MLIGMRARIEAFRGSLFFVPSLYVLFAIALAQVALSVDLEIGRRGVEFPTLLTATVDSARALLGTVAGATITFAGVAFSVSLLMFQLASSQYSPRVLYGFFRDSFSKRVMGVAVGTFTYCLLVLRVARKPLEEGGTGIVPTISVLLAVALGIVSVLAIVAFINHGAHSMEAAEIIRRITEDTHRQIARLCPEPKEGRTAPAEGRLPEGEPLVVVSREDGWVREIDVRAMFEAVPEGGIVRVEAGAGHFVARGRPLCTIWPAPSDPEPCERAARRAVGLGRSRTMQQDMAFGFRQLADIALRALSPGVNDPTTAYEAIVHIGSLLRDLLLRDLPPRVVVGEENRRMFRPHDLDHRDYVDLAFDQIRLASRTDVATKRVLLETAGMLVEELDELGLIERAKMVRRQAKLIQQDVGDIPAEDAAMIAALAQRLDLI